MHVIINTNVSSNYLENETTHLNHEKEGPGALHDAEVRSITNLK
jgi:hypothetical protein